jgi:hypothetical protein
MGFPNTSGGLREDILDADMISTLGLDHEAILAIEGRMKIALTQARFQFATEHNNDMDKAMGDIRKKMDETMAAMHVHWQDKNLRNTDHWRDQITSLKANLYQVNSTYESSVVKQKELVCR